MTKILGKSVATAKQMSEYLLSKNKTPKFSKNISALDFCQLFLDVCTKEGVRGDIAFAQSCKETAYFKYGGDVKYTQNNFAGIGATGGGVCGCIFSSIEEGILAQAQHLKTYATKDALNEPCVDPRRTTWFINAKGGTSPNVETLGGTWAVPGYSTSKYSSLEAANAAKDSYGYQIIDILNNILKINVKEEEKNMANKPVIALSAGHGLYTAGKRCMKSLDKNETREWYLNDRIVDKIEFKLQAYECTVVRVNDTTGKVDTPLATRATTANNANADIYIAMHHNAGINGGSGGGTVVFYYPTGDGKEMATDLYNHIIKYTGLKGNRSKPIASTRTLYEVRVPKAKAFLIENGFMDSRVDVPVILSESHAEKTAMGVVDFLVEHFNLKSNGKVINTTTTTTKPSTPNETDTYTVQKGDTLSKIGTKTGVAWKTIANLNGIKFPYTIAVGQVLKLREVTTTSTATTTVKGNYDLIFDATYYSNTYPDLKKAFGTNEAKLLNHFKTYGMKEGRQAIKTFNVKIYKENNADLRKAFGNAGYEKYFEHYMTYGYKENRKCV